MRVLIVDPSPLARNIYRLLLRSINEHVHVVAMDSIQKMRHIDDAENFDGLIIAGTALDGYGARYRGLFTDVDVWANMPKVVIPRPGTKRPQSAWANLPNASIVSRPFRPDEFADGCRTVFEGK
jgi:hypothetical protein